MFVRYILQWESKHIIAVSTAIQDWLTSSNIWFCTLPCTVSKHFINNIAIVDVGLAMELMKQGAMRTVLSGILAAFAWPATLLAAADFIDSKWSVAIDRYTQPTIVTMCFMTTTEFCSIDVLISQFPYFRITTMQCSPFLYILAICLVNS